jgi:hypothetical protein
LCGKGELPSKEWSIEISLWSGRMKNSKTNKWERERFVFHLVEVFREGGWIFVSNRGTKRFVV